MRGLIADPVFLSVVILAAGLAVLAGGGRRTGRALLVMAALGVYTLATPWVAGYMVRAAAGGHADGAIEAAEPQAIVVLSAGLRRQAQEYGGDTVDALTLERLRYAARLHRRTGLPLAVTGGRPDYADSTLAEVMRHSLEEDFGVPVRWFEDRAGNTAENALNTAMLLRPSGIDTIFLVTHAMHMPRSRAAFERVGFVVVPAATVLPSERAGLSPEDLLPQTRSLAASAYALHEMIGGIWYRLGFWYGSDRGTSGQ